MKSLGGKPLYRWVADAARTSGIFKSIIVMSDWQELLDDAEKAGYNTLKEPAELAGDQSYVTEAMAWALDILTYPYAYVQLLQATSPFLKPKHIQDAASLIQMLDADMVVGLTPSQDPTAFVKPVSPDWSLKEWYPQEFRGKRRQEFPTTYSLNGYIYLAKRDVWAMKKDWWTTKIYGLPMEAEDHIDIDTREDFEYADWKLRSSRKSVWSVVRDLFQG
jgi:CMP-N-acetylneuraminic acid synthetase